MSDGNDPEIVTYKIPKIEVYQVTDDELSALEASSANVGHDITFATSFLGIAVAVLLSLIAGTFSPIWTSIFIIVFIVSILICIFTGIRWLRTRKSLKKVISKIRSRKVDPDVSSSTSKG